MGIRYYINKNGGKDFLSRKKKYKKIFRRIRDMVFLGNGSYIVWLEYREKEKIKRDG